MSQIMIRIDKIKIISKKKAMKIIIKIKIPFMRSRAQARILNLIK